jgi:LPS sulfotransferase NodH
MSTTDSPRFLLLCATHRTGSNLLEQHLRAAGVAGNPKEYYSPELSREYAQKHALPDPDREFLAYQAALVKKNTVHGVFGAKIMWRHLEAVRKRVNADPQAGHLASLSQWQIIQNLHPQAQVVHITRRDKVKQAISMVRAKMTGVYSTVHLDRGTKEDLAPGEYDFHLIQFHVEKLQAEDEAWRLLFAENGIPVQTVIFEEFVKNPLEHTKSLISALGLPQPAQWDMSIVSMRPQADAVSAEWRKLYDADAEKRKIGKCSRRERRHRARKALERQAVREARWAKWEKSALGRVCIKINRWWASREPLVTPEDARGDGVVRPRSR